MKKNAIIMGWILAGAATAGLAAEYTWDGGGTADTWSTGANWNPDGSVPVSASDTTVKFDGGTRRTPFQDIATPCVLNRIDFLGGVNFTTTFTLDGNPLLFATNGIAQPVIYLQRNATCVIKNDIGVPAGTTLNLQISTYGVTLSGLITGEGALDKSSSAGGISLDHADNTFSGGLTIRAVNNNWSKFNVNASGAMGSGPVKLYGGSLTTALTNPGGLTFYNTTSHTNTIGLFQNSPIFTGMPNSDATVTLDGDIDLNTYTLYLRGGGSGTIGGAISEGAANAIIKTDAGTWTLSGSNTFTGVLTINNGILRLGTAGTLDPQVKVTLACTTGWAFGSSATLDLNGCDQQVSELSGSPASPALQNRVTSAAAAKLTVNQVTTTLFNGSLTGALALLKQGTGTLMLSNSLSTATGNITVSNGTLTAASDRALGNSLNVTVAGGTLHLQAGTAIDNAATVNIAGSAKIRINAGLTETIDKLFINGVQQARGTYGTTASGALFADDTYFEGTGQLYIASNPPITPTVATWDAEGTDTLLSTAANWEGDTLPAFDGTTYALFGTGGSKATIDTNIALYGLSFVRDATFTLEAGNGIITNGFGGIFAQVPSSTSRTYTIAEDLFLSDNQTWSITNNGSGVTSLIIDGAIADGSLPCDLIKNGPGALTLTASNTFDGAFTASAGDLRVYHSRALGSTNGNTTVRGINGARLLLYGNLNLAEPLILNGDKNNAGTLLVGSGQHLISGPVTCISQVRLQAYNGALTFSGGITSDNDGLLVVNAGSFITFTGKPLRLGTRTFWSDSGGVAVLAVASNTWADALCAGGGIRCDVADALPPNASLRIGIGYSPNGTLNLNGYNQKTSKLYVDTSNPGTRRITSATPAQLTVNQSVNTIVDVRFTGAVSLLKLGSGNLTLTNATTDTTGSFVVSNGTLTVDNQGTLGANCTNIVVAGTGTLALRNSTALGNTATLSIAAGGAKIDLATGVNELVGYLNLDDLNMPVGTYGATGSGAQFTDATHFAGQGILTVLRSLHSGTLIIIR